MGGAFGYSFFRDDLTGNTFQDIWRRIKLLRGGCDPSPKLRTKFLGIEVSSPIAGGPSLDLNGGGYPRLLKLGLGFIELGPVTPTAEQTQLPYLKISQDSVTQINTEPSLGSVWIQRQLLRDSSGPRGINISAQQENIVSLPHKTDDDFCYILSSLYPFADFFTINLSCSLYRQISYYNNPIRYQRLIKSLIDTRDLEIGLQVAYHSGLIQDGGYKVRRVYAPVLVKINSDWKDVQGFVRWCKESGVDGVVVGSEGEDVQAAREVLEKVYLASEGRMEVVSYGGIKTGREVLERIIRGANAVQVFEVLIRNGGTEVSRMQAELLEELEKEGFRTIEEARGSYYRKNVSI